MKWKRINGLAKETFNEFFEDRAFRLGAALAYYSIFSIAPLLIIVIALAGFFLGEQAVREQIQQQLRDWVGEQGTAAIVSMVGAHKPATSLLTTIIGLIVLLFGASGVFGQLQDSLNVIWEVQPKPGRGIWGFIRSRFLSFAMVLGVGFLLLVSMVISALLSAFTGALGSALPMPGLVAHALNFIVSFLVITLLFAMIFKVLPDARVRWRDVWMGAIFTALLFSVGKYFLGFYLGRASTTSSYGAAGSLVIVLLWVYYSSLILFFGAEFTQVHAKAMGSRIVPTPEAVPVTEEARAEQGLATKEQLHEAIKADAMAEVLPAASGLAARSKVPTPKLPKEAFQEVVAETKWKSIPKTNEIVRRRPWPYLGAALGLGIVTGWLVKRDAIHHRGLFQHLRH